MSDRCGNPLFRDWMKEWMDDANSMKQKSYYTYKKAYDSLCRCPVSFSHPSEAKQLNGIGDNLAKRLEERLIRHCEENGLPLPFNTKRGNKRARRALAELEDDNEGATRVRPKKTRTYVPAKRSGGYAILLCLLDFRDQGLENINQSQICREGQKYADTSFSRGEAGSNYTAFSSIKTLMKHGYVWKNGSPARYSLTETGIAIAEHTRNVENGILDSRPPRLNDNSNDSNDYMNDMPDGDDMDDDLFGLDLSLYVLDPSKHSSISLNGRTRTNQPSSSNSSSQNITSNRNGNSIINSVNGGSNRNVSGNRNNRNNRNSISSGRSTQDRGDLLGDVFGSDNIDSQLSLYVLDPSKHSSISLNGGSKVYERPNTLNSTNGNTTLHNTSSSNSNSSISNRNNALTRSLPFELTDEELAYNMSLSRNNNNSRASSVESDIIEILSPPPTTSLNSRIQSQSSSQRPLSPLESPLLIENDSHSFPPSQSQQVNDDTFHYTYIDADGKPTRHFTQAQVKIDPSEKCIMYRLRFFTNKRQHKKAPPIRNAEVDPEDQEYSFAYVREVDIIDAICPGLPDKPTVQLLDNDDDEREANDFWMPENNQSNVDKSKHSSQVIISSPSLSQIDSSLNMFPPATIPSSQIISSSQTSSTCSSQPVPVSQLISESQVTLSYSPGEYEIILVLDCREIQMQKDRQYFQRMLKIKGINVITRSLDLGDVIWVARKKGHESPADELYLDFIVERKRLDDLVTSIKDGRFTEQKSRLKRSGSRKVIYIVEEYDREGADQFGKQAIQTAMSSTQVIDGFFLKRTNNPEETIDYLVKLTRSIENIYKNTTLHAIPEHIITRQNYVSLKEGYRERIGQNSAYLVTYPLYCDLNKKSGSNTIHDIFMRMLMTIRGINAERALSLMKIYPTPSALLQAFSKKTPEQGKTLAKDATKDQIARRKWTGPASEKLYEIWGVQVYPEDEGDSDINA